MVREGQRGRREPRMWFTEAPGGVSGRWNRRKELVESGLWSSGGSPPHRRGRDPSCLEAAWCGGERTKNQVNLAKWGKGYILE